MTARTADCPKCGERQPAEESALSKRGRCWKCQSPLSIAESPTTSSRQTRETTPATRDSSTEIVATAEATIGKVGRFELRAALGQGAFGRVYRAYDPLLDRSVALKLPRTALDQPRRIARFLREAKAAARLRHPNIVAVFESGKAGDDYFIASEFVEGVPLSARIAEQRPELREAVRWVQQIAEGLAYAHSEGVIHRDIKPANIMLGQGGRPQLMDFGMAKRLDEDATMTTEGSLLGTPAYMSPEQARSDTRSVGAPSDQYSLGVVLYELLTGRKPFDGPPHVVIGKVTNTDPPAPRSLNPAIPRDLEAVCLKAMAKEPKRRYASVAEFAADLEHWLAGENVVARPAYWWERLVRWCRHYPAMATMGACVAASLLLAAGLGVSFAIYESRVAAELKEAVAAANLQRSLTEEALGNVRFQSQRANAALTDVQTERDQKAAALAESELQRERAQAALGDAERQRIRAETALAELQSSRAEAESERAQVRRLLTETYLDRGLRQCAQGDTVQGMLWLAESLQLASESSELAEYARVARENLAAWRSHVARAKRQRPGEVVLDASPDGETVLRGSARGGENRPETQPRQPLFQYADPLAVVFSADARTVLVVDRQNRTVQSHFLGGGVAAPSPAFEGVKVFKTQNHAVVHLSSNGRRALIQEEANLARMWDVRARQTGDKPLLSLGSRRIQNLSLSPSGRLVACLTARMTGTSSAATPVLLLYDTDSSKLLLEREIRAGAPPLLAFSHHSRWLLAGDQLFDTESHEPLAGPLPFSETMRFAAFGPAGSYLATTSARSVWLWDSAGQLIREIPCNREIDEVAYDGTGQYAVTRDRSQVQVWDTRTGRPVGPALEAAPGTQPFVAICLPPTGDFTYVAAAREVFSARRPLAGVEGSVEQLRLWVQVLTEAELAKDGSVRLLDGSTWETRLERLRRSPENAG